MKKILNFAVLSPVCCSLLALMGCTSGTETAGVSTVETENALVIQVFAGDAPANGAVARVRSARYLQSSFDETSSKDDGVVAEYKADSKGFISITKKDCEKLEKISVEVADENQGAFGVYATAKGENVPDSVSLSMEKFGSLKGHVVLEDGDTSAVVRIYGTDRFVVTDSKGNFEIEDLPPYDYSLYVNAENTDAEVEGKVSAAKTQDVGDIILRKTKSFEEKDLISSWMKSAITAREEGEPVVGFIRLNSKNFDFDEAMDGGEDVQVLGANDKPLPFAISYWNDSLQQAVIQVLLDSKFEYARLAWGAGAVDEKSSGLTSRAKLWGSVPAEVTREQNMVRLMDFESGFKKADAASPASVKDGYFEYQGDSVSTTPSLENILDGIEKAGADRDGYALHWKSSAAVGRWSDFGQWFSTPDKPCNMEGVDSVEYFIRGTGRYAFAFEAEDETGYVDKAFYFDTLKTANADSWKRTVIRQSDFAKGTGSYANTGWDVIRTRVTNYNIDAYGEAELWLDDIKIYGINWDDIH
ncbi:MAG: carboxypeptidase-like regulatory domain-containing protein [Fibrobacter sp.]|nr:carboxypeptidase-like regulatory domain-containing protein [Fibrobacter sp.]